MRDDFSHLRETLLRAGVRPKTVNRYIGELRDHLDDLIENLEADGISPATANHIALKRLGSTEDLAKPMIVDPRFLSLTARMPRTTYLLIPVLAYAAGVALLAMALAATTQSGYVPAWFGMASWAASHITIVAMPLILAWTIALIAHRQRSNLTWPLRGIGLIIFAGATTSLGTTLGNAPQSGTIGLALSTPSISHLITLTLCALAPIWAFKNFTSKNPVL